MSRSFMARLLYTYFKLKRKPTEAQAEKELDDIKLKGETESPDPKELTVRCDNNVFYANENTSSKYIIFYIHGGGYQHDFSPFHWKFIKKLIDQTDAAVIAPAYHLIPFGNCQDAFDLIVPLYRKYVDEQPEKKFIIMGDSSGGGLSLALVEYLKAEKMRIPNETILLSPWVDASMDNPELLDFTAKDPWLTIPWLKVCGRHWAGQYNIHDYRVSPIYGNVDGLKNITVFLGTRELFYPDIVKFFSMLDAKDNELIIGQDMMHVFPILPIPEAKKYCSKIIETIIR